MLALAESIGALRDPTLPDALFYPFGVDVGDMTQPPGLDLSSAMLIDTNFPFYNASHKKLFVSFKTVPTISSIIQNSHAVGKRLAHHRLSLRSLAASLNFVYCVWCMKLYVYFKYYTCISLSIFGSIHRYERNWMFVYFNDWKPNVSAILQLTINLWSVGSLQWDYQLSFYLRAIVIFIID